MISSINMAALVKMHAYSVLQFLFDYNYNIGDNRAFRHCKLEPMCKLVKQLETTKS